MSFLKNIILNLSFVRREIERATVPQKVVEVEKEVEKIVKVEVEKVVEKIVGETEGMRDLKRRNGIQAGTIHDLMLEVAELKRKRK